MSFRSTGLSPAYRWADGVLKLDAAYVHTDEGVTVADSWLVSGGRVLAIGLHADRFVGAVPEPARATAEAFFCAATAALPDDGEWFPRVQHRAGAGFALVVRPAPARARSIVLASHPGNDPRTVPTVKGPDFVGLLTARGAAGKRGADDAVILSPDGFVVEGTTTSLLWWRGETLCSPAADLPRMDSVTAGTVIALAMALGVEVSWESAQPRDLEGLEVWALNSLHGIRIVTGWVDGPTLAEQPGRLTLWRTRLDKLTRPLGTLNA